MPAASSRRRTTTRSRRCPPPTSGKPRSVDRAVGDDGPVTASLLSTSTSAALRDAPFTYDAVGSAPAVAVPAGFEGVQRTQTLGRRDFAAAANDLLSWRVHERAGLRVRASEIPLETGTVTLMRLGVGPASVSIPCRVVAVVDEARRRGFSYGSCSGTPRAARSSSSSSSATTAASTSRSPPSPVPPPCWRDSSAPSPCGPATHDPAHLTPSTVSDAGRLRLAPS